MANVREDIISMACELYSRYGIKAVSMDDIARELSISKKTIYENFASKEAVVEAVLDEITQRIQSQIDGIGAQDIHVFEKLFRTLDIIASLIRTINQSVLLELKKRANAKINSDEGKRSKQIHLEAAIERFRQGVDDGYIDPHLDPETVIRLFALQWETVMNGKEFDFNVDSFQNVYRTMWYTFMMGISTEKGRQSIADLGSFNGLFQL